MFEILPKISGPADKLIIKSETDNSDGPFEFINLNIDVNIAVAIVVVDSVAIFVFSNFASAAVSGLLVIATLPFPLVLLFSLLLFLLFFRLLSLVLTFSLLLLFMSLLLFNKAAAAAKRQACRTLFPCTESW